MSTRRSLLAALFLSLLFVASACENKPSASTSATPPPTGGVEPIDTRGEQPPKVEFPLEARTADASLNEFVEGLLDSCVKGDYQSYRLAVSSQYEPMVRRRFQNAWHAVKQVRIRKVMLVYTPTTQALDSARTDIQPELRHPIYCMHATITLKDQTKRPVREVVVLVIRENDRWKLGGPAPLKLKYEIMGVQQPAGDLVDNASNAADAPASRPSTAEAAE